MKTPAKKETANAALAIKHLNIAANLLELESRAEQNGGRGRTDYDRLGSLTDFSKRIRAIISSDNDECGLAPFVRLDLKGGR